MMMEPNEHPMMIEGQRYLVTGGTGFIGSAMVRRLLAEGAAVRVLDDGSRGSLRRLAGVLDRVDLVSGDVRDPDVVRRAAEGIDVFCHLAYVNGTEFFYRNPDLVLDVGVKGIVNALDACRTHGIRRFVLASSSEVYQTPPRIPTPESVPLVVPDPLNPRYSYGAGKIISEVMAINFGRNMFDQLYIFRPHNVFGPDMGWEHVIPQFALRTIKLKVSGTDQSRRVPFPIQGDGEETRAFIFIDDFIDGFVTMLSGAPGIYHIGSESETRIRSVAEIVGRCLGIELDIGSGPLLPGSTRRRCPDTAKLRALGFAPRVPLEEAIDRTVRWYAANASLVPLPISRSSSGEPG